MNSVKRHGLGLSDLIDMYNQTNGRCYYCGCKLKTNSEEKQDKRYATIDHGTPQSRGGDNDRDNLFMCCKSCNSKKGTKTITEYRNYIMTPNFELMSRIDQVKYITECWFDFYGEHVETVRNIENSIDNGSGMFPFHEGYHEEYN